LASKLLNLVLGGFQITLFLVRDKNEHVFQEIERDYIETRSKSPFKY